MLEELSFVKASKYRKEIIKSLVESPKTPTEIGKDTETATNIVSKYLKGLGDHNLVYCINPEVRKGKLYKLTDLGEKISHKI